MGNIKTANIKTVSDKLLEMYPERFDKEFKKNKGLLDELMPLESKSQRNKIAGFISHTMVKLQKLHTIKISYQNPNLDKRRKGNKRR